MFKELLQDVITEKFLADKISAEKFSTLIEKAEVVSEEKAYKILGEIKLPTMAGIKQGVKTAGSKLATASGIPHQRALFAAIRDPKLAGEMRAALQGQLSNANAMGQAKRAAQIKRQLWMLNNPKKAMAMIGGAQATGVGAVGYGGYKVATRNKK